MIFILPNINRTEPIRWATSDIQAKPLTTLLPTSLIRSRIILLGTQFQANISPLPIEPELIQIGFPPNGITHLMPTMMMPIPLQLPTSIPRLVKFGTNPSCHLLRPQTGIFMTACLKRKGLIYFGHVIIKAVIICRDLFVSDCRRRWYEQPRGGLLYFD